MEAAVTAAGVVLAATIPALITRRSNKAIKTTLGTKNGQGDVVAMLEHLKAWTQRHEGRHDVLEQQINDLRSGK